MGQNTCRATFLSRLGSSTWATIIACAIRSEPTQTKAEGLVTTEQSLSLPVGRSGQCSGMYVC
jgi:hypothetical protein